jgi:hypothetical protein
MRSSLATEKNSIVIVELNMRGEGGVDVAKGVAELGDSLRNRAPVYCFFVDDAFCDASSLAAVRYVLERYGFDYVHHFSFDEGAERALRSVTGVHLAEAEMETVEGVIVTADVCPLKPDTEGKRKRASRNRRINLLPHTEYWVKHELAALAAKSGEAPPTASAKRGILATTTRTDVSMAFLHAAAPDLARRCSERALALADEFECPFPVLKQMGGVCYNARVFMVDYHGERAACKVFRKGRTARYEAARDALLRLADSPYTPDILDYGDNWVLMTAISGPSLQENGLGLFPLRHVKEAFRALAQIYSSGVLHLDFHPDNLMLTPDRGLQVFDFEGSYTGRPRDPATFWRSPIFRGAEAVDEYDLPASQARWFCHAYPDGVYERHWYERVGLTAESLRRDSPPLQHIKRMGFAGRRLARRVAGGVVHRLYRWVSTMSTRTTC